MQDPRRPGGKPAADDPIGMTPDHPHQARASSNFTHEPWPPTARGYFAIGAERMSKAFNLGNLMRSAHGFGASFTFTVGAEYRATEGIADTSKSLTHTPHYSWAGIAEMAFPDGCALIGIELLDDAIDLPSFHHPKQAAYVLGPELGSLSPDMLARCDYTIRIPTRFCLNVAMAGAIVMYDRIRTMARFADRAMIAGGPQHPMAKSRAGQKR